MHAWVRETSFKMSSCIIMALMLCYLSQLFVNGYRKELELQMNLSGILNEPLMKLDHSK